MVFVNPLQMIIFTAHRVPSQLPMQEEVFSFFDKALEELIDITWHFDFFCFEFYSYNFHGENVQKATMMQGWISQWGWKIMLMLISS